MLITINGKGMEISDSLREVAEKQAGKMAKYFPEETEMQISMSIQHNRHVVEVTIPYKGSLIRAEAATGDMYASINAVLKKIEKQVIKHRDRYEKDYKADRNALFFAEAQDFDSGEGKLVKTKKFSMKPMTVDEAIMQFEMLDHPFFVFRNIASGEICVLYVRNDGDYGLIEPVE